MGIGDLGAKAWLGRRQKTVGVFSDRLDNMRRGKAMERNICVCAGTDECEEIGGIVA